MLDVLTSETHIIGGGQATDEDEAGDDDSCGGIDLSVLHEAQSEAHVGGMECVVG